ncbi:MAG: hypothetical protein J5896_03530 [Alphaproteobacteria bacterium]|nr:hypothetical protein [Alphaproteobacteria bacterium]
MTIKNVLKKNDFDTFIELARKGKVSKEYQVLFYKKAPELYQQTLINFCPPSQEAEKVIIEKGTQETINLVIVLYGLYSSTLEWMMRECDANVVTKVLECLHDKPATPKIEHLMVERGDQEIFKLWLSKFYTLEDSTERILNERLDLSSMLSYYIEMSVCS